MRNLYKFLAIIYFYFCVAVSKAQQISIQTINSAGVSNSNNSLQLESSVGGFLTETFSVNGTKISQGFLQPYIQLQAPLPVLGLEFNAKRINNNDVQLDWKTVQEIDNKGFHIERKKETDVNFTQLHFVKSVAANGNSSLPLTYSHVDTNSFRGKTYYRLKQEDVDGKFMYSTVRLVNGISGKIISLKAWPIPSTGPVNISVDGIEKDVLLLFDNNGSLIKQIPVTSQTPVQFTGLAPGTYIVKLGSQRDLHQKIIMQ